MPKFPNIHIQLSGHDGNAFAILGRASKAMREDGVPKEQVKEFFAEATSGNYDNLLQTIMRWVETS